MVREDLHLPKQPTGRAILALSALTVIFAVLGLWISQSLTDRQRAALERTLASLAAERVVLHEHWSKGTVPATVLTAETAHIDEEAAAVSAELSKLQEKASP